MITDPTSLFVYLACLLAAIQWASGRPWLRRLFLVTPAVLYVYFLPTVGTALGVSPAASPAYDWMVRYLLPFSLMLLMVTVDVKAILRLGGTALVMMLAGSAGIIVGGPLALAVFGGWLPPDAWKGLAALSGSWIGGSANLVAIKEAIGTPDALLGPIIVVDTLVAYSWMGVLLVMSGYQRRYDAWVGADTSALEAVQARLSGAEAHRRPITLADLTFILALGLAGAAACVWVGDRLPSLGDPTIISHTTWTVILVTALGLALSFTPLARLERAGASRIGYLALYLMLAAIGAQADLAAVLELPLLLAAGVLWVLVHIVVLLDRRPADPRAAVLRRHRQHGQHRRHRLGAGRGLGLQPRPGAGRGADGRVGVCRGDLRQPAVRLAAVDRGAGGPLNGVQKGCFVSACMGGTYDEPNWLSTFLVLLLDP